MERITVEQIRAARAFLGMSQEEFAKACGLSAPAIQSIECGRTAPRSSTLDKIKEGLIPLGIHFFNTYTRDGIVIGVAKVVGIESIEGSLINPRRTSFEDLGKMYAELRAGGSPERIKEFIEQLKGEEESNRDLIDLLGAMLGKE